MSEYCEISGSKLENKKIKFVWEEISRSLDGGAVTYRAKVLGGWLVNNYTVGECESMVFIPDKNHEWEIK